MLFFITHRSILCLQCGNTLSPGETFNFKLCILILYHGYLAFLCSESGLPEILKYNGVNIVWKITKSRNLWQKEFIWKLWKCRIAEGTDFFFVALLFCVFCARFEFIFLQESYYSFFISSYAEGNHLETIDCPIWNFNEVSNFLPYLLWDELRRDLLFSNVQRYRHLYFVSEVSDWIIALIVY